MSDPLTPTVNVLCKLGSLAVHVEEALSRKRHVLDIAAMQGLLADKELQEWLKQMAKLALLPVKR